MTSYLFGTNVDIPSNHQANHVAQPCPAVCAMAPRELCWSHAFVVAPWAGSTWSAWNSGRSSGLGDAQPFCPVSCCFFFFVVFFWNQEVQPGKKVFGAQHLENFNANCATFSMCMKWCFRAATWRCVMKLVTQLKELVGVKWLKWCQVNVLLAFYFVVTSDGILQLSPHTITSFDRPQSQYIAVSGQTLLCCMPLFIIFLLIAVPRSRHSKKKGCWSMKIWRCWHPPDHPVLAPKSIQPCGHDCTPFAISIYSIYTIQYTHTSCIVLCSTYPEWFTKDDQNHELSFVESIPMFTR